MSSAHDVSLVLDGNGSYLGMEKGCFVLRDKNGEAEKHPLLENHIKEVVLRSGNAVSTGALSSLGFWGVDVVVETARGRPVAMLKAFDDDRHVATRLAQYDAVRGEKGMAIAKEIVKGRASTQNIVLEKYGLECHDLDEIVSKIDAVDDDKLRKVRQRLTGLEGNFTSRYWSQILPLVPKKIRPKKRKKFLAYDGVNNLFNLGFEVLQWKVHRALVKAYLEPYLGFLHGVEYGQPSLVCDMEELYRFKIEDKVIEFSQGLSPSDFVAKNESASRSRMGKRVYLNKEKTNQFMSELDDLFKSKVLVATIRAGGKQQRFETLINEDSLLFAKYLRNESKKWGRTKYELRIIFLLILLSGNLLIHNNYYLGPNRILHSYSSLQTPFLLSDYPIDLLKNR